MDILEKEKYTLLNKLTLFSDVLIELIPEDIEYNKKYKNEIYRVKIINSLLYTEDYIDRILGIRVKSLIEFIKKNGDIIYTPNNENTWENVRIDNTETQISLQRILSTLPNRDKRIMTIIAKQLSRDIYDAKM